jgi:hypothetical protein
MACFSAFAFAGAFTGALAGILMSVLGASFLGAPEARAADAASQEAMAKTLELLRNPALRAGAVSQTPEGRSADQQLDALSGSPEISQEIYELSAEIFQDLVRSSDGDSLAMLAELEKAKSDPKAFAARLSPATREKLRSIAGKIDKKKQGTAATQP